MFMWGLTHPGGVLTKARRSVGVRHANWLCDSPDKYEVAGRVRSCHGVQIPPCCQIYGTQWANYDSLHSLDRKYDRDSFLSLAVRFGGSVCAGMSMKNRTLTRTC